MWDKESSQNINGKKRKRLSIRERVYLYEFCISYIIQVPLLKLHGTHT